jgi:hypothetical protein
MHSDRSPKAPGKLAGPDSLVRVGTDPAEGTLESPAAMRERKSHIFPREQDDHYVEPTWVPRRLFQQEAFQGLVWDPAAGFGRIIDAAIEAGLSVRASDLVDRGCDQVHIADFFSCTISTHNIVTNVPFAIAERFALHALNLATRKVAMLLPLARLNAAHWLKSTPLYRIWLLTPRPSMPPGRLIAAGHKPSGGRTDFCWLVWVQGFSGRPELRWLHRDKESE